jgi:hypothetical protein
MTQTQSGARFDDTGSAVVVEGLVIDDRDVVREARRWTSGRRGPRVEETAALAGADLTTFATEALLLGARALAATAQTGEARALEQMVKDVGERTAEATARAAELTGRAAQDASEAVAKVASDAKRAITEADENSRKEITQAVRTAKQELVAETRRIFGGERPELLDRLQPLLEKFGSALESQVRTGASELLEKAAKQFDPADPASPMARHAAALAAQQEKVARQIERSHENLAAKVDGLTTAVKVQQAKASIAKVTPIKGGPFEEQVHELMRGIAAGLGDEYEVTSGKSGTIPRCMKGDGLLTVSGQPGRLLVEMTDSARSAWGEYLDVAERNRGAAAALGVVRSADQNAGMTVRVLGTRRVVVAFDPGQDDPEVLRTAVMLLRTVAIAASVRTGAAEIETAEEKIAEALKHLEGIDAVKRLAGLISKNASKIDSQCTGISTAIHRLLDQALAALAATPGSTPAGPDGSTSVSGAA